MPRCRRLTSIPISSCAYLRASVDAGFERWRELPDILREFTGANRFASAEELRREVGQIVPPVAPHVAFFRWRERVFDLMLFHDTMQRFGGWEQAVRFAARDVEE